MLGSGQRVRLRQPGLARSIRLAVRVCKHPAIITGSRRIVYWGASEPLLLHGCNTNQGEDALVDETRVASQTFCSPICVLKEC